MYFQSYRMRKTWLPKCLKSPVSVHPRTVKMLKAAEHCLKMRGSSVVICFHHFENTQFKKVSLICASNLDTVNILTPGYKLSLSVKVSA